MSFISRLRSPRPALNAKLNSPAARLGLIAKVLLFESCGTELCDERLGILDLLEPRLGNCPVPRVEEPRRGLAKPSRLPSGANWSCSADAGPLRRTPSDAFFLAQRDNAT